MDFALVLLGYRAEHLLPELHSYPGSSVPCLSPDEEQRNIHREHMLRHWHIVLQIEKLAPFTCWLVVHLEHSGLEGMGCG